MPKRTELPEWEVLLLPSWVSDWLWLTGVRSWQLWMGESLPVGSVHDGFSIFFISISSWCIQRSGGLRSFWLPFLLLTLWVARFLWNKKIRRRMWVPLFNSLSSLFSVNSSEKQERIEECSQEETYEIQELAGMSWLPFLLSPGASPHYRSSGAESPRPRLPARECLTLTSPATNSHTRWQWVRGSHMPIFGASHKALDWNICLGDKWRSCFERANRNKKARICASQDWGLKESL